MQLMPSPVWLVASAVVHPPPTPESSDDADEGASDAGSEERHKNVEADEEDEDCYDLEVDRDENEGTTS